MTNANDWKRFEFYVPGIGKVVMATDGDTIRGIATNLMPMTARLAAPDEQMEILAPDWDRAAGGPKPEWFDDPQGTFARLRRERDELEGDFVALYGALDRLHFRALMSRSPEGHDATAFSKTCADASILIDRLAERPWHKKKKDEEDEDV